MSSKNVVKKRFFWTLKAALEENFVKNHWLIIVSSPTKIAKMFSPDLSEERRNPAMILMKRKGRRVQKPQLDAEPFVGRQQVAGQHRVGGCGDLHHWVDQAPAGSRRKSWRRAMTWWGPRSRCWRSKLSWRRSWSRPELPVLGKVEIFVMNCWVNLAGWVSSCWLELTRIPKERGDECREGVQGCEEYTVNVHDIAK